MSETTEKRRPGARPKGPKSGKGATMATRITAETRAALEAEAERTGRSLSQVAEMWLEEARQGRATVEQMLGGLQVADAVRAMIALANRIQTNFGDPTQHLPAREALVAGWAALVPMAVPFVASEDATWGANWRGVVRGYALSLLNQLNELPVSDRRMARVTPELLELLDLIQARSDWSEPEALKASQMLQATSLHMVEGLPDAIMFNYRALTGNLSLFLMDFRATDEAMKRARIYGQEVAAAISQPLRAVRGEPT